MSTLKYINEETGKWEAVGLPGNVVLGGVESFNGRAGVVVPQEGDYTAEMVGAARLNGDNNLNGNQVIVGRSGVSPLKLRSAIAGRTLITFDGVDSERLGSIGFYEKDKFGVLIDNDMKTVYHTGNKPTAADVGAAPAGYGLGGAVKKLTSADDLNTIWQGGWYYWGKDVPTNAPSIVGSGGAGYQLMFVSGTSADDKVQEYWSYNHSLENKTRRVCRAGTWTPLEYYNPPMALGVEYRTTERYNSKPVYVKRVNVGKFSENGLSIVQHGCPNVAAIVRTAGWLSDSIALPYVYNSSRQEYTVGKTVVNLTAASANFTAVDAIITIYFIKTTD